MTTRRSAGAIAAVLIALVLGSGVGAGIVAMLAGRGSAPPVYDVARVSAGLRRRRAAWAGRTFLVRGTINDDGWGMAGALPGRGPVLSEPVLVEGNPNDPVLPRGSTATVSLAPDHAGASTVFDAPALSLQVVQQPEAASILSQLLRRLPFLARVAPVATASIEVYRPAAYRVRLYPQPRCWLGACYDGELLIASDGQPPAVTVVLA